MGSDWKNQLFLIIDLLGTPEDKDKDFIENPKARQFLNKYPKSENKMKSMFKKVGISNEALDLLGKMLIFDPTKRYSVE